MNYPSVPHSNVVEGYPISNEWRVFFTNEANENHSRLSEEGHIDPHQPFDNIQKLNIPKYTGGYLYDTDAKNPRVNMDAQYNLINTHQSASTAQIAAVPSGQRDSKNFYDTDLDQLKAGYNDTHTPLASYQELTTAEINALPVAKINGHFFRDTTTNELKVGFNNTIHKVTTV